jgi:hypothetical protein
MPVLWSKIVGNCLVFNYLFEAQAKAVASHSGAAWKMAPSAADPTVPPAAFPSPILPPELSC